jgi:hypothetical protein
MTSYTNNYIESKMNVDAVGLTAGESDSLSPYQPPDLCSSLMREWPEEMSAADFENMENFLEYIITK